MRALFISDLHLPVGPTQWLRPELRRSLRWMSTPGTVLMNRFERHLRGEAERVMSITVEWLKLNDLFYDLVINGGDVALPLSSHHDRLYAAENIWTAQLKRYGESRLLVLTGNHELGHGYQPELSSYPDLMDLRSTLFNREINRLGYGFEKLGNSVLLALDSELISMSHLPGNDSFVRGHLSRMAEVAAQAIHETGPIIIITHNTFHARRWLNKTGLRDDLFRGERRASLIGGHYHIPRTRRHEGYDIHWSGGASYPEPWLKYLVHVPFTGFHRFGPGGIEINSFADGIKIHHRPFGVPLRRQRLAA